ncbi:MAG TPA: hypothetical protein VEG24_08545 [Gaiellaceae bacterium]|nr:hypothetical protein [Gaiellaceae bacterium]
MKTFVLFLAAAALLALGASQALARTSAPASKTVVVAMHDPGCHWFAVNGKFLSKLTVTGPVKLANFDEAALLVAGPKGVTRDAVGKAISLAPGVYHITMVGQAPDDNHLKLVVR